MKVGVIGSGTMGAGIVQVLAMHGHEVVMNARHQESVDKGIAKVEKSLAKLVAKEKIAADAKDAAMAPRQLQRTWTLRRHCSKSSTS